MQYLFNDDDAESTNGNWKNSDIITSFSENFVEPLMVKHMEKEAADKEASVIKEAELATIEADLISFEQLGKVQVNPQSDTVNIDKVIESLAELAVESTKYGNEKATYRIERAVEDLRSLKGGE